MKTIQGVIFVTLCLSFGSCDVPGTLVGISRILSRAVPTCLNTNLPVCGDCKTLWKCQNSAEAATPKVDCKAVYPDRPHCSNGACTALQSSACSALATFRCTDAGYYPNPLNCSRYHLCGSAGAVGTAVATYECPSGFVYNTKTTLCKPSATASTCTSFDCTADPYGYVPYPDDNAFFASCSLDSEPIVLRCPLNNVYEPAQYTCVFKCPREGRIPDPTDKSKYYECYLNGTTFISQSQTCVDGFEFNDQAQQCVKSVA